MPSQRLSVRIASRTILTGLAAVTLTSVSGAAYGVGIEPTRLVVICRRCDA